MIKNWLKNIGPGSLVAAAFIGPGTVTVCTLAGVNFGYALLWALLLSVLATVVLQEMSARLGIITQKGLSEVLREEMKHPLLRISALILILSAIVIGNAAYEAGNISGGILGLETLFGQVKLSVGSQDFNLWSLLIGLLAFVLLFFGNYKLLERTFIGLVVVMGLAFIATAIITKPNLSEVFKGLFIPKFSEENILTVVALVGTTVVPYNLFLHASLVREKWKAKTDLNLARKDTLVAIILGGTLSMCIVISATAIQNTEVSSAADLALGLEPLFGDFASYFMSIGLFSAGITSAITAPLAAAYVASGCLGWKTNLKSWRFRLVWLFILLLGVLFSTIGSKSIEIIKFAQVANGLLLPIIAGFLLWAMNRSPILGNYKNTLIQNVFGFVILGITVFLGLKSILKVFEISWV